MNTFTRYIRLTALMSICALAILGCNANAQTTKTKAQWVCITDHLLAKFTGDTKPAFPGKTGGLVVDRANGDLYMVVCGQGLYRSVSGGLSYQRYDGGNIGGRCETAGALQIDPNGKRMACFMLDGPAAMTVDEGTTWTPCSNHSRGFDFAAVDWTVLKPRTILAVQHESSELCLLSTDGAVTWREVGHAYTMVGVFDSQYMIAGQADMLKWTSDGGRNWKSIGGIIPVGHVVTMYKGVGYLLTTDGVYFSDSNGEKWAKYGTGAISGQWGPYIGKDAKQMMVASQQGIYITEDGGAHWKLTAPFPPLQGAYGKSINNGWFVHFGWDPNKRILYAGCMGSDAYRFQY